MVTLEQLKQLKSKLGLNGSEQPAAADKTEAETSDSGAKKFVEPVEIPCKNYEDEIGHFAYIDTNTNLPEHVNLTFDKKYTQDEINYLSFKYAVRDMPDVAKKLNWHQVISKNTLYDQFGSPVFTAEEIKQAIEHPQTHETPSFVTSSGEDAFGLK